jgi:Replication initiation factor
MTTCPDLSVFSPARFDWYQGTVLEEARVSAVDVLGVHADAPPARIKGQNGYSRGWALTLEGETFARIYQSDGKPDHVLSSGPDAHRVARVLRAHAPHQVTRADVCLDYAGGSDTFRRIYALAELVALGGSRVTLRDVIERTPLGEAATLYVGSRSSENLVRLYEKGKQDTAYPADTVRLEVQVRPDRKDRKVHAASLEPEGFWGFAKWARTLRGMLGDEVPAVAPRSARVSDLDGALNAMTLQYGARLLELAQLLEGDLEAIAVDLLTRVYEHQAEKGAGC